MAKSVMIMLVHFVFLCECHTARATTMSYIIKRKCLCALCVCVSVWCGVVCVCVCVCVWCPCPIRFGCKANYDIKNQLSEDSGTYATQYNYCTTFKRLTCARSRDGRLTINRPAAQPYDITSLKFPIFTIFSFADDSICLCFKHASRRRTRWRIQRWRI